VGHDIRPASEDLVQVILHHRIGQIIDGEDRREKLKPIADPQSPMFVRDTSLGIEAAEKRAADTTMRAVEDLNLGRTMTCRRDFLSKSLPLSRNE
jgi:hypothetical protein